MTTIHTTPFDPKSYSPAQEVFKKKGQFANFKFLKKDELGQLSALELATYKKNLHQYRANQAEENLKKIKNPRIERTIETRQLILKGRLLDRLIKNGQVTEDVFKSALSDFLIKDTDRELFGLAIINIEPVAETAVSANNNSQQLLTIQSYDPQRRDEAIEAIENMTDYMDMEGIDNIGWLIDNLPRTISLHSSDFTDLEFSLQALNAAGCVAILSRNQNHDLN